MQPTILFRKTIDTEAEFEVAKKYFPVSQYRSDLPKNSLVIGRYSVLPFYNELCYDLQSLRSQLINTYRMHKWIADFEYYDDLIGYTPETWHEYQMHECDYQGPFVVKGRTNSRKHKWNTHMYAPTKADAMRIGAELAADDHIGQQGIIYRKFVQLKVHEIGLHGLPFSNEWRMYYYKDKLLAYSYYWSIADKPELAVMDDKGLEFASKVSAIVSHKANFYIIDIAQKVDGNWTLIEVNDAQMGGLSLIQPDTLYSNLVKALEI